MTEIKKIREECEQQDLAIRKFAKKYSIQNIKALKRNHFYTVLHCYQAKKEIDPERLLYFDNMILISEVLENSVQSITFELKKKKHKIENQEIIKEIIKLIAHGGKFSFRLTKPTSQYIKPSEYRAAKKRCVLNLIKLFTESVIIKSKSKNQLYTIINEFLNIGGNGFSENKVSSPADLIKKLLKS